MHEITSADMVRSEADNVMLMTNSPLLDAAGCGLIGALGVGCGATLSVTAMDAATMALAPNPSKGRVEIAWSLPQAGEVDLAVFDITGRQVARLASAPFAAGNHTATWDGETGSGPARPGLYFVRLRHDGREATQRLLLRR